MFKSQKSSVDSKTGAIIIESFGFSNKNNIIVSFRNVCKTVQGFKDPLLQNCSFSIPAKSITVITGKSGAGKTTLLKIMNGLETYDSGDVIIDGTKLNKKNKDKIRKKTAFVFQNFNLFPNMNILKNIIYTPIHKYKKNSGKTIKEAENLLKQFNMLDYKNNFPHQLSGGQKQRVAIMRSLILSPEVLLMDEPTASLDPELSQDVSKIIKNIHKQGISVIIVSHDTVFIKKLISLAKKSSTN